MVFVGQGKTLNLGVDPIRQVQIGERPRIVTRRIQKPPLGEVLQRFFAVSEGQP